MGGLLVFEISRMELGEMDSKGGKKCRSDSIRGTYSPILKRKEEFEGCFLLGRAGIIHSLGSYFLPL